MLNLQDFRLNKKYKLNTNDKLAYTKISDSQSYIIPKYPMKGQEMHYISSPLFQLFLGKDIASDSVLVNNKGTTVVASKFLPGVVRNAALKGVPGIEKIFAASVLLAEGDIHDRNVIVVKGDQGQKLAKVDYDYALDISDLKQPLFKTFKYYITLSSQLLSNNKLGIKDDTMRCSYYKYFDLKKLGAEFIGMANISNDQIAGIINDRVEDLGAKSLRDFDGETISTKSLVELVNAKKNAAKEFGHKLDVYNSILNDTPEKFKVVLKEYVTELNYDSFDMLLSCAGFREGLLSPSIYKQSEILGKVGYLMQLEGMTMDEAMIALRKVSVGAIRIPQQVFKTILDLKAYTESHDKSLMHTVLMHERFDLIKPAMEHLSDKTLLNIAKTQSEAFGYKEFCDVASSHSVEVAALCAKNTGAEYGDL